MNLRNIITFRATWVLTILMMLMITQTGFGQQSRHRIDLKIFRLQSSDIIKVNGKELSSETYHARNYWFPVTVPSTVLAGLVANKVYPSPYFGMNNMRIPDASDTFDSTYHLFQYSFLPNNKNPWKDPYWYRTRFRLPKSYEGKLVWLTFKGINYRAAVWLNGQQISDTSKMVGMFGQYRFNITNAVHHKGINYLAVEIYPLDYPGLPSHPQLKALGPSYPNGGPTGDIGKNVTMLCSAGWNWVPAARGREEGIWQPVYVTASGPVTINQPHIITQLPDLPDTNRAAIRIQALLENHSHHIEHGRLQITIKPHNFKGRNIHFTEPVEVKNGQTRTITLSPEKIKALQLDHPHLWWPNGQGKANLYQLQLRYIADGKISDASNTIFGIRTISTKVTESHGWPRRDFYINGRKIHLLGGAWVPDLMLKRDSTRYAQELELIKNANLNLVRIWGGGITPPDAFFNVADKEGLLVWQDFWTSGDTQGRWGKGSQNWPLQGSVFMYDVKSTIIRLRNHPSLLLWTGGNEYHPRKNLYEAIRNDIISLDGTRPFIASSDGNVKIPESWKNSWPDNKPAGFYSGGPYIWVNPADYFDYVDHGRTIQNKGKKKTIFDFVFKDEAGILSLPPYNSLKKIIPDLVPDTTLPFPLNNTWGYHDFCTNRNVIYYNAIVDRYGEPASIQDFTEKAQLVNANSYRAIFESVESQLNQTGGVLLWKLNTAWPSLIQQIYDWYLEPNAGYYYIQKAAEPLHVQLNLNDSTVAVINRPYRDRKNLSVHIRIFNRDSKVWYNGKKNIIIGPHQAKDVLSLKPALEKHHALSFVELTASDQQGHELSKNFYWLAPDNKFEALSSLPKTKVTIRVQKVPDAGVPTWRIHIQNSSDKLAFFVRMQLMNRDGRAEVLPSFWRGNYVNLPPHENITLTVHCQTPKKGRTIHYLKVSGWNIPTQMIGLQ